MMRLLYGIAADVVVLLHFSYVLFVVLGFLLILIGAACRWQWVRNFKFRALHLLAILIVACQAIAGVTCPLTTLEKELRQRAGQTSYEGDFIAEWVHFLMFFDAPPWVFTLCYTLFGLAVLATFILAPPRYPSPAEHKS